MGNRFGFTQWPVALQIARNRAENTGVRQRVRRNLIGRWVIEAEVSEPCS